MHWGGRGYYPYPRGALYQHIGADTKLRASYQAARCKMCVYRGTSSEKRSGPEVLYNQKNLYSSACRSHTDCMDVTNTTIGADMSLWLCLYAQNMESLLGCAPKRLLYVTDSNRKHDQTVAGGQGGAWSFHTSAKVHCHLRYAHVIHPHIAKVGNIL